MNIARQPARERALLVAVDFTAQRRPLTRTAALSREAARASANLAAVDYERTLDPEPESPKPASLGPVFLDPRSLDLEASLQEFRELVTSAGAEVAAEVVQRRPKADPATLIGSGKVQELAGVAASTRADVILFDHDLTPTQLRNLDDALPCRVVDRTQLILDIFARHARTREGQLQVELAQLEYMLPRLTGRGASMSQLGGGIGTRGPGETQLETDRRRIQRRLQHLKQEIEGVRRIRAQQRQRRESVPVPAVALVGYTNAGKSTLFNAMTDAGVLESARMFATLDPKLKTMILPSRRKILLSDTVGFIRNLPHTLVTSFRATLEEVQKAEVLVHVRDCSSPMLDEHKAEVEKVLGELGVLSKPRIEVLNKIDLLAHTEREALEASGALAVSARLGCGIDKVLARIDAALVADPILEQRFEIPQSQGNVLAALGAGALIRRREFIGDTVSMTVAGPASLLGRYRQFRIDPTPVDPTRDQS
ncbi:MAG TPA: GTPase HflX [Silvibacterium sp.]|nr:GTPase HflX [Silvibacterium sp.]